MNVLTPSLTAVLLASLACSPDFIYVPVTNSNAVVAGRPAADYPLASSPRPAPFTVGGDLRLATFGIVTVHRHPGADVRAIKVRVVASNNGDDPWTLDTREQHVELEGGSESLEPLACLDGDRPATVVRIDPGARHVVDIFFPLPPSMADASRLPAFDVLWSIQAGPRRVVHRTQFDRRAVEPERDDGSRWEKYAM
jgi:hypothetical protein